MRRSRRRRLAAAVASPAGPLLASLWASLAAWPCSDVSRPLSQPLYYVCMWGRCLPAAAASDAPGNKALPTFDLIHWSSISRCCRDRQRMQWIRRNAQVQAVDKLCQQRSHAHITAAVLVYMFTARRRRKEKDAVVPGATATISDVRAVSGGLLGPLALRHRQPQMLAPIPRSSLCTNALFPAMTGTS